ncbi:hypothetical protein, variant [Loa loa]|nr:hypothetical protein, variant [Loa loa]EJD75522.1 hypothetical protein, variant [Loa loa]
MAQHYGYAGQPPYPQPGYQNGGNPYQQGPPYQHPPAPGFNPQVFMPPPPMHPGVDAYVESGGVKSDFGFNSASIRAAFVRKVFILVSIMLAVVTLMTAIPFLHRGTMTFVRSTPALYFGSYFAFLVVYMTLICCESVRRSFPGNLIALSILTLSIGYMTMMICSFHGLTPVLLCLIITVVCCAGIIIFSSQTKYDLTSMYGMMFIVSLVLLVFGIVAIIAATAFQVTWLYTVYAGLAALLFMVYLAIDVQTIMGGRRHEISPEDYILAAIQVFLDIVYIFWMLLTLFGSDK